ncbi:MAG: hypothetical protein HC818_05095, partial [Synechococcaceae cyanobacterium RM1_1_27]|nr:hypothetical protein [Synechococcaceae cyanobacterium RM1_1_27]
MKGEAGYFTEVAIRLRRGWRLAAAISARVPTTTVRLGGEGHRALVAPLENWKPGIDWDQSREGTGLVAYLLTPGLASLKREVQSIRLILTSGSLSLQDLPPIGLCSGVGSRRSGGGSRAEIRVSRRTLLYYLNGPLFLLARCIASNRIHRLPSSY